SVPDVPGGRGWPDQRVATARYARPGRARTPPSTQAPRNVECGGGAAARGAGRDLRAGGSGAGLRERCRPDRPADRPPPVRDTGRPGTAYRARGDGCRDRDAEPATGAAREAP